MNNLYLCFIFFIIYKIIYNLYKKFIIFKNFQYYNIENKRLETEYRSNFNVLIILIQKINIIKYNNILYQLFSKFINKIYKDASVKFTDKNKNPITEIKKFCNMNGINYDEKNWIWEKKPLEYESINDFFMRRLKKEIIESYDIISPVTGVVIKYKNINCIGYSIKGDYFDSLSIMINNSNMYSKTNCYYFYLSPSDYHCFHSPIQGYIENIVDLRFIDNCSGSVKPDLLNLQPNILIFNKRYIITIENGDLKIIMVIIGGFNVDSIIIDSKIKKKYKLNKGEYIGSFGIGGSAVLLLTNKEILLEKNLKEYFLNKEVPIKINMGKNFANYIR